MALLGPQLGDDLLLLASYPEVNCFSHFVASGQPVGKNESALDSVLEKDEIWQAWTDLEGIKLNEVSQMDKYHIILLIFSIKK